MGKPKLSYLIQMNPNNEHDRKRMQSLGRMRKKMKMSSNVDVIRQALDDLMAKCGID